MSDIEFVSLYFFSTTNVWKYVDMNEMEVLLCIFIRD